MTNRSEHTPEERTNDPKKRKVAAQGEALASYPGGVLNGGGEADLPNVSHKPVLSPRNDVQHNAPPGRQKPGRGENGSGSTKGSGEVSVGVNPGASDAGVSALGSAGAAQSDERAPAGR